MNTKTIEQFQENVCTWLREKPLTVTTLAVDRHILSGLVLALRVHGCKMAPYFERVLTESDSPTVMAGAEELRELTIDLEYLIIFRRIVGKQSP